LEQAAKKKESVKIKIRKIFLLITFAFVLFSPGFSQDADIKTKLRLAQILEREAEWEQAVVIYEELYKYDSGNYTYLNGLQRSYTQLKEYNKAIGVIHNWLIINPRDMILLTTLGGLYYDLGNESAADSAWKSALSIDPHNVQSYRIIADEMMKHRLYERCINTYINGRIMCKNEAIFADELGTLYFALQQYASAAQEYIRLIKNNPDQLSFVQSRFNSIITKPEALRAISETVKKEVKNVPENIGFHRLYIWLLLEEKQYDKAFEHYRMIDRLTNANGNELYAFAQRLNQEHAFAAAAEVFKEIIDHFNKSDVLPHARYGYARALEEISNEAGALEPESQPAYRDAIQIYESISSEQGHSDLSVQSLFRIGVIKFDKLFDLDGALSAFNKIRDLPNARNILFDAEIEIGEVQTARNDLVKARVQFERVAKIPLAVYQDKAVYRLAELNYFETQFDSSLSLLKQFNTKLNTDLTNDALQLQYFIQENKTSSLPGLIEFAKADLQMHQRKYPESLSRFLEITKQYPNALFIDDAMMKIGELYLKLNRPKEAIAAFNFIADSIQLSILKDKVQFRIGEIFENILHNTSQAISAYEKLLEKFPNSLYAEQARKRIRMLRGDNLL
jgi:tetratricopeptide (TPR) repeat protein